MALLDHPKNVQDSSGEKGFQWTFNCDICASGFSTTFIPSASAAKSRRLGLLGRGASMLGSVTGQSVLWRAGDAAHAAEQYSHMSAEWHKEHDGAFMQAVNETKTHFKKCPRCKLYVCEEDWNDEAGLCTRDAPSLITEMQAHVKAQTLFTGETEERATLCPTCGKPSGSGKFCQNCGTPLGYRECPNCHHQNPQNVSFCGECGTKL